MRITVLMLAIAFTRAGAQTAQAAPEGVDHRVTVCVKSGSAYGITPAEELASKMFAGIGVTLSWLRGLYGCPEHAIVVTINNRTPDDLLPGALARSLPFEGVHIDVFYDRIVQDHPKSFVTPLLAHVLAHEIGHILQAFSRHSASGIMKAKWEQKDFEEMAKHPLQFTAEDVDLIERGLSARRRTAPALHFAMPSLAPQ